MSSDLGQLVLDPGSMGTALIDVADGGAFDSPARNRQRGNRDVTLVPWPLKADWFRLREEVVLHARRSRPVVRPSDR